jgi:hypothetical protein
MCIANQLVMLPDKAKTPTRRIKEKSSRYKKPIKIIKIDIKLVIKDLFIILLFKTKCLQLWRNDDWVS